MRKLIGAGLIAISLAACGTVPAVVTGIFDLVNAYTMEHCGYSFTFATIDAVIKALSGQPIADVVGGLLCTQARSLVAQQAPKATGAVAPTGQSVISLGTVLINGKPVQIQVLR